MGEQLQSEYFTWAEARYSMEQCSELALTCNEISTYFQGRRILKKPLFDTDDLESLFQVQSIIQNDKIFRFFHKKNIDLLLIAIESYITFLFLRQNTTRAQTNRIGEKEPSMVSAPTSPGNPDIHPEVGFEIEQNAQQIPDSEILNAVSKEPEIRDETSVREALICEPYGDSPNLTSEEVSESLADKVSSQEITGKEAVNPKLYPDEKGCPGDVAPQSNNSEENVEAELENKPIEEPKVASHNEHSQSYESEGDSAQIIPSMEENDHEIEAIIPVEPPQAESTESEANEKEVLKPQLQETICYDAQGTLEPTKLESPKGIRLNEEYILSKITPHLNSKRELSEFEFSQLFSTLTKREQYEVINIMIANDIEYVDEKEEETQALAGANIIETPAPTARECRTLLPLTNEELCVLYQQGEEKALDALVEKNKRFIMKYVLNAVQTYRGQCLTEEDLFQEGVFGLMKAAEKFDASLSFSFLTYCGHWLFQAMSRAVADTGFLIRLPVNVLEKVKKVAAYRRKNPLASESDLLRVIECDGGFDPPLTIDQLRKYAAYGDLYLNTVSLNTLVSEDGDTELMEFVPDKETDTEGSVMKKLGREAIFDALDTLSPKQRDILIHRFGLNGEPPMTLEEMGGIYGVTRERIRQIEDKALRRLRHPSRRNRIVEYWEDL